jgi:anthranilate synthase component 1
MTHHFTPTLSEFRELATRGNLIPVFAELIADAETPCPPYHKLDDGEGYAFLFESVEKHDQAGRYSFVGVNQRVVFESQGTKIRITEDDTTREFETEGDPLTDLEQLMQRYRYVASPTLADARFAGGAVGYLSYDVVRFFEPTVPQSPPDDLGMPESLFTITEALLIFDHRTRRLRIVANAHLSDGANVEAAYQRAVAEIGRIIDRLNEPARLPMLPITAPPVVPTPTGIRRARNS